MKQSKILLFISFFVAHSCIAPLPVVAQEKKKITLDDLYKNYTFRIKDVSAFMMMKDGEHYTERDADADKDEINVYDVKTGKKVKTLLNLKDLYWDGKAVAVSHYEFSKNEDKLLLFVDGEAVYRRSAKYKVYVYELDKKEHNALEWSEKGNSARLYLLDNDKVLHASF
ncbi:MAG: hypothetical protein EBX41_07420, partial [Chitinophagia bacterium]|nr:hypothetical protein [Chitinophagia bacterium]